VRNWTLDGQGFGHLLLGGQDTLWFHEPIAISPTGELRISRTGLPVTATDRLAMHRVLSRAVGLPAD
jgi:hypothetical protein